MLSLYSPAMSQKRWKVAAVSFDHGHQVDLLNQALKNPAVEVVGAWDESLEKARTGLAQVKLPLSLATTDLHAILTARPDLAILCCSNGRHAEFTEKLTAAGLNVLVEKPFAPSLADADRMITAAAKAGKTLAINWPIRWFPPHVTGKRLVDSGAIGTPLQVHYMSGNRGPVRDPYPTTAEEKKKHWWYRSGGGGSLLDYLGYGATFATWFLNGQSPTEVTAITDVPPGCEVDEHSITILNYGPGKGLSKLETRWGLFTDPWVTQTQPRQGFTIVGTEGTLSLRDYDKTVTLQTRSNPQIHEVPVDTLVAPHDSPINHILHHLETGAALTPPLSPALCRIGQQIVDTAFASALAKKTLPLLP